MREDEFPHPVSDPEAEGLPGTADDDSSAWDDVDSPRVADGPEPGILPRDREDGPLAIDRYGTTPEEQRVGESLDRKLDREVPDPALEGAAPRPDTVPSPIAAEAFDPDPSDDGLDLVDQGTGLEDEDPVDPHLDSKVSMYDTGTGAGGGTVGRLVEPDEGLGPDNERDAVATDVGASGGGASAEELAMHQLPGD
ncbi:DUF5709 domain-containing protein [Actinoplanes sp. NPDC051411]|uniref:DUF5709 domain-containing protein n=1 Tax=Actinoplanes sp. NPDC051411 TaxID=3155522 RepID=UPI00343CE19C